MSGSRNKMSDLDTVLDEVYSDPTRTTLELDFDNSFLPPIALPSRIGELTQLTVLRISDALPRLEHIPEQIGELRNLTAFELNGTYVQTLPASISQLTNLVELSLPENDFEEIPIDIRNLPNLKILNLSDNVNLNLEIGNDDENRPNWPALDTLMLDGVNMETVPLWVCALTQLHSLTLNFNNLTTLPDELGQLTNLTELLFSGNADLDDVPDSFVNLNHLIYIECDGCAGTDRILARFNTLMRNDGRLTVWRRNARRAYQNALVLWRSQSRNNLHTLDAGGTMFEVMKRVQR